MKLKINSNGTINKADLTPRAARRLADYDSVAAIVRIGETSNAIIFRGQKKLRTDTEYQCRRWAERNRILLLDAGC